MAITDQHGVVVHSPQPLIEDERPIEIRAKEAAERLKASAPHKSNELQKGNPTAISPSNEFVGTVLNKPLTSITLSELKAMLIEQENLTKKINEFRQARRSDALSEALELIASFHLTKDELFKKSNIQKKTKASTKEKSIAKYKDTSSNKTWTGHGREPNWIKNSGKDKSHFLIS